MYQESKLSIHTQDVLGYNDSNVTILNIQNTHLIFIKFDMGDVSLLYSHPRILEVGQLDSLNMIERVTLFCKQVKWKYDDSCVTSYKLLQNASHFHFGLN